MNRFQKWMVLGKQHRCVGRFVWAVLLSIAPLVHGQLVVSEFMANNHSGLKDEDGDYSDWIEILNPTASVIDLGGWFLTDDPLDLAKWKFPRLPLSPRSYLVVYASEKNRVVSNSALHTNFRLDAKGEYLSLVKPDGVTVAFEYAPKFPIQEPNISYGESNASRYYFASPTPGRANGTGILGFSEKVKFSHSRGFFDSPFDLTLSTVKPGSTIRYTTNGEPPTDTTGNLYSGPISINHTTTLRAATFKPGYMPSTAETHSYIFLDDVIRQSPNGQPADGWPSSWGANTRDYGMDPDVVNDPLYSGTIRDDLKSIPSFSIVMNLNDLFERSRGIYANPGQDGSAWERPTSVELLFPSGEKGFQINAGIRIRGGFSRSTGNPKHALRLFFREEYGESKLRFPLFGDAGTDEFDNIDLRTFQNYSWSFQGDNRGVFLRDQFSRDTQLAMVRPSTRGEFYHLYINGQYWGLYNTQERSEASYAETYFGGRKDDYDVIKVEAGPYTINATDGNLGAWSRLYTLAKAGFETDAAYQRIQGNNPDGTRNPDYEVLLDVPNLIDYMLVIFYGGNLDAPISNFLQNTRPNNWYGIRNRNGEEGFRFFAHDSEHTLLNVNEDRTGPFAAGDTSVTYSNPQYLWKRLQANPEFRLLVADHVQRHCYNGGVLTPESAEARFLARKNEIDRAVVGESARWGDAKRGTPFKRTDWLNAINGIVRDFFPRRTTIVVNQLRADAFVPSTPAPAFNQHGGIIAKGFVLNITSPMGIVYFTRDGSDPRLPGGIVSSRAQNYAGSLRFDESVQIKSRTLSNGTWSALTEASFTVEQTFTELLITEIMYHPSDWENTNGDDFEFIELKNISDIELDLSGVQFTEGIRFTFPIGSRLGPGQFVVLVRNEDAFRKRYPGSPVFGVFTGGLSNAGERLVLAHATGVEIHSVAFGDGDRWPAAADGVGFSLVPVSSSLAGKPNSPENWRASALIGGSPGLDDPTLSVDPIWLNEVVVMAVPSQENAIEIFNPGKQTVDLSYWYLTDERSVPKKYRFVSGTMLSPQGYLVVQETSFSRGLAGLPGFALNRDSKTVCLYSADSSGEITGFSDVFRLGVVEENVSIGRYSTSIGETHFIAQASSTFGAANSGPRVGPIVINEIQYHPPTGEEEFVELKNISDHVVPLYEPSNPNRAWRLNGANFEFPAQTEIPARGILLVTGSDPALFRLKRGIPPAVIVLGPIQGVLQDGGEQLELQRPIPSSPGSGAGIRYANVDVVQYKDQAPWPVEAAGSGPSLERLVAAAYGNDPINWRASPGFPSPGFDNTGNRSPQVNAGPDRSYEASVFPIITELEGAGADDGLPDPPGSLAVSWTQVSGPAQISLRDPRSWRTSAGFPTAGTFVLRLTVSDGEFAAIDEVIVQIDRAPLAATFVPAGSAWRYLDDGSNQGAIWRSPGFNDSSWRVGKAQLGYGDGDEVSGIGFGPASNNKNVTTYFRHTFDIMDAARVVALTLRLLRDDGAIVYLNGREVVRSNMPEGSVNYRTYASAVVGGEDESTFFEHELDASLLRDSGNVLAVEVHQANATSSDISFDLELAGLRAPGNQRPIVAAGPNLEAEAGSWSKLGGTALDDGFPAPPGSLTVEWTVVSGPGSVTFQNANVPETSARFDVSGEYVLRLSASDGEYLAEDLVLISVRDDALRAWRSDYFTAAELADSALSGNEADPDGDGHTNYEEFLSGTDPRDSTESLRIESASILDGAQVLIQIRFQAVSERRYWVQSADVASGGEWTTVREFDSEPAARWVEFFDPIAPAQQARFYRVTLAQ
ncbi:MAG: lamin tail domain-containing protein [Verrucomicrobia bacterium]|nr:lamin tail domain-containing protein [Verrucomicrobiota bacterium]